jgi:23S rRNA maturation-related 3'-5' exoribonuclease YhaM
MMKILIMRRMKKMRERFNEELLATKRYGMDELIECMEDGGFYEAPCSGAHHLAEEGGLLIHSLNVLDAARALNSVWGHEVADDSLTIIALLHDLGKMGDHGKPNYVENYLTGGKRSEKKPFTTNSELVYVPHEVRSVMIAERYIRLSEEEEQAILWHNGLYGSFKYDIQGKETAMYMILHFADMWASRIIEQEEE